MNHTERARIAQAAELANRAHAASGQVRKGTGLPYIVHPFRVATLVEEAGGSADQIAAAWCHDVLEDCRDFRAQAKAVLPPEVLALVLELTKPTNATGHQSSGAAFIAQLRALSPAAKLIKLADRLDNLNDLQRSGQPDWAAGYLVESDQVLAALTGANPAPGPGAEDLARRVELAIAAGRDWVARAAPT